MYVTRPSHLTTWLLTWLAPTVLLYSRLKHEFYTIDFIVNFDKYMTDHSPWLLTDDAFFHSVIMSTSAMQDFFLGQPLSDMTLHHLRKTLALLNRRLSDGELYQMDSTIWIILTLAMVSGFFCDFSTTVTHIAGLRQIVHLQGGRGFLEARPKMQFKLESLEFSSCLSSGAKARLWGPPMTWDAIFPSPSMAPIDIPSLYTYDERIMAVLSDLRELVALANSHVACELRLDGGVFQMAMSSIRYRSLFLLEDDGIRGTTAELLCLGILAFLTTTFAVPGRRLPYPYLATRVRGTHWKQGIAALRGSCHLDWWILLMCAMTVVDVEKESDRWFRDLWVREINPETKWFTLRQHMQKISWFPNIHDRLGQQTFLALGGKSGS